MRHGAELFGEPARDDRIGFGLNPRRSSAATGRRRLWNDGDTTVPRRTSDPASGTPTVNSSQMPAVVEMVDTAPCPRARLEPAIAHQKIVWAPTSAAAAIVSGHAFTTGAPDAASASTRQNMTPGTTTIAIAPRRSDHQRRGVSGWAAINARIPWSRSCAPIVAATPARQSGSTKASTKLKSRDPVASARGGWKSYHAIATEQRLPIEAESQTAADRSVRRRARRAADVVW